MSSKMIKQVIGVIIGISLLAGICCILWPGSWMTTICFAFALEHCVFLLAYDQRELRELDRIDREKVLEGKVSRFKSLYYDALTLLSSHRNKYPSLADELDALYAKLEDDRYSRRYLKAKAEVKAILLESKTAQLLPAK